MGTAAERQASGDETIFARATAAGEGAVAILRLSGPGALSVLRRIFRHRDGTSPRRWKSHRVRVGQIRTPDTSTILDEVMVLHMEAGRSFTGEDLVEIHCHGSPAVLRSLEELLRREGLRPAGPGEFTRRAFLSGRVSLDEAEAVNDLVRSRSEEAALIHVNNLGGVLKDRVTELRSRLLSLLALLEANVDFPEDEVDPATHDRVTTETRLILSAVADLAASYERGRILRDGIRVVLAGRPNVGKSSLMNALLQYERCIVTDVPGTTRDTIEESLAYRGLNFTFIDTAGLRVDAGPVEREGIQRTRDELTRADLIVTVVDASCSPTEEETSFLDDLDERLRPHMVAVNKCDLVTSSWRPQEPLARRKHVCLSALSGEGIEGLLEALESRTKTLLVPISDGPIVVAARHRDCLSRALSSLEEFLQSIGNGIPLDMSLIDLYEAVKQLGLITGAIVTEDILEEIFRRFCIGK